VDNIDMIKLAVSTWQYTKFGLLLHIFAAESAAGENIQLQLTAACKHLHTSS